MVGRIRSGEAHHVHRVGGAAQHYCPRPQLHDNDNTHSPPAGDLIRMLCVRSPREDRMGLSPRPILVYMGTTWVLDTETKGTGANMVPLERVTKRSSAPAREFVLPERRPPQTDSPKPRGPRRFRILDVMTRQHVLEDGSTREAVETLRSVRSIVDVNVYVWDEERERWLLLPFAEQRRMLDLAQTQGQ